MKKTLILFIDAFSFSDLKKENVPFIFSKAENGYYGRLKTIPAGYHIEYSMLSGCLPLKHNVWSWYYMKKGSFSRIKYIKPILKFLEKSGFKNFARNIADVYINLIRFLQGKNRFLKTNKIPFDLLEKFEITVDKMHFDHNPLPVPTLFDILRKNRIKYVGMEFPVFSNNKKTGFYFTKDESKQIRKAINLLDKYDVVYLHVWNLDGIEHKYGLHSKEALKYLRLIDKELEKEISGKDINLIIFSDHGGCEVIRTRNIKEIFKNYDADYFIGSTMAQIWFRKPDKKIKEELKKELKNKGYLVYDESNIKKELFIPYRREFVGDLMAAVKPHEQIYPDFFRENDKVKSMHGYTEKVPELDGVFVMNGFGKGKIKEMSLYDIAPTILKAMKINIPRIWDGKARV